MGLWASALATGAGSAGRDKRGTIENELSSTLGITAEARSSRVPAPHAQPDAPGPQPDPARARHRVALGKGERLVLCFLDAGRARISCSLRPGDGSLCHNLDATGGADTEGPLHAEHRG